MNPFNSKEECSTWVSVHTPFAIKPIRKAKTIFIFPFSSVNAMVKVTESITEDLYKFLSDENKIKEFKKRYGFL